MLNPTPGSTDPTSATRGRHTVEISDAERQQRGTDLFFRVKLIADPLLLAYHLYAPPTPNYPLVALLLADLLFLIPYYFLIQRRSHAESFAIYVGLAINILVITADMQTTGTLFSS
ncbi:MAG: hypothetical protein L0Y55_10370, partial [Anaerolineales bacterium]|nr:hypothetical protein [Anaerolineales bacterium]